MQTSSALLRACTADVAGFMLGTFNDRRKTEVRGK